MSAPIITPASDHAELCFHGLAHLPLAGPERLYEPRYLRFAASLPPEARDPLVVDAPQIAAMIDAEGSGLRAQWLPRLHRDVASFLSTGRHELSALGESDAEPRALRALGTSAGIEWLRADLLLVAAAFASASQERRSLATEGIRSLAARLGELSGVPLPERIEVCSALGTRGRAFPDAVVVGAPAPWWCRDDVDEAIPAVVAVHEHAVRGHTGDYVQREWHALCDVARQLAKGPLARSHQRWLASLDLRGVLDGAHRRGWLNDPDRTALSAEPDGRAERLRGIARSR